MNLPRLDKLKIRHDYWKGSFYDFSGNGNTGVPSDVRLEEKEGGPQIIFGSSGVISVPYSSELDFSDQCTMVFYGDGNSASDAMVAVSQGSVLGDGFSIILSGVVGDIYQNSKMWAITNDSSGTLKTYYNGLYNSDLGNNPFTNTGDDIYIGNYYDGSYPYLMPLKGFLIYNAELTADEIKQVYEWIEQAYKPVKEKRTFYVLNTVPKNEKGLVAAYRVTKSFGGSTYFMDETSNSLNMSIVGQPYKEEGGLCFDGSVHEYATRAYDSRLKLGNNAAIAFSFRPDDVTGSTRIIISYGGLSYATGFLISQLATTLNIYWNSGGAIALKPSLFFAGRENRYVIVNNNGTISLYIDGEEQSYSGTGTTGGAITSNLTTYIGGQGNAWNLIGSVKNIQIYNEPKDSVWVKRDYEKYILPYFVDDCSDYNESVSNET